MDEASFRSTLTELEKAGWLLEVHWRDGFHQVLEGRNGGGDLWRTDGRLAEAFNVASLDAFGSFTDSEAIAALLAIDYVRATQAGTLPRLARPVPQGSAGLLAMDAATRASLEIHRARDGGQSSAG